MLLNFIPTTPIQKLRSINTIGRGLTARSPLRNRYVGDVRWYKAAGDTSSLVSRTELDDGQATKLYHLIRR